MTKRTFFSFILMLSTVLFLTTGCGSRKQDSSVLRIGFPAQAGTQMTGPEGWAYHTGAMQRDLKPLGITNVQIIGFPAGPDVSVAMAANAIDVSMTGDTPALVGRAAGLPTRLINISAGGGRRRNTGSNIAIMVSPNGPKTVWDLRGKKVGVVRGTNMERFLLGVLDINKLTGQVQIVHIPSNVEEAAIRGHSVDAACSGYSALLIKHGFISIADAGQFPQLTGTNVTLASERFLREHPGFPKVWNEARRTWYSQMISQKDDYYKFASANARISPDLYSKLYPLALYTPEPFTPEAITKLNGSKSFLLRVKLMKNDFSIGSWRAEK